jgi:hypothetical protein
MSPKGKVLMRKVPRENRPLLCSVCEHGKNAARVGLTDKHDKMQFGSICIARGIVGHYETGILF